MRDWKGSRAFIMVASAEGTVLVYDGYLDTDTVADVMDRYDISKSAIIITSQPDAEGDGDET